MTEYRFIHLTEANEVGLPSATEWGAWSLAIENYTLCTRAGGYLYDVDLERCTSSAEVLDWICQIAWKTWGTAEVVGDLVHAFNDVLHPQSRLCSFGQDKRTTPAEVRAHLDAYWRRAEESMT